MMMKAEELYQDETFYLCQADGTYVQKKGLWLVVDGGYHRWRVLQCPVSGCCTRQEAEWSARVCSVRKDVECVFGILKTHRALVLLECFTQDPKSVLTSLDLTATYLQKE